MQRPRRLSISIIVLLVLAGIMTGSVPVPAQPRTNITVVPAPVTTRKNSFYTGNRAPLQPSPLIKLPLGSIQPQGWLRQQLLLSADGMTGFLPEVSRWAKFEGNAWVSKNGQGEHGWEELPYWLKGYVDLGYILQDARIQAEAKRWIEGILSSQRSDGYFGPESNRAVPDIWPNMLALYALRSHYEATGDRRVLLLMKRYFQWMNTLSLERILPGDWQKWRGGDNLDIIHWLYNRTGDAWLLNLARINHERTADWTGGIPTWHGVNLAQGFREPGQFYLQARDVRYLKAAERNYATIYEQYGQVPGGMYGADENARPGYFGPRQGAETCAMVEMMYSHEMLLGITGNPLWADRCEDVAFNSFPASMTPDLKALHYLTAPNQVQLDRQSKSPMIQHGGDMFSYSPFEQYRCCQHNVAFGWPYYAQYLWMATPDDGLAATLYSASSVKANVGDGASVTIEETTDYPFRGLVDLKITTPVTVSFPLYLRVPGWCDAPRISINGKLFSIPSPSKGWIRIQRAWRTGDRVNLELPMKITVQVWEKNRGSVSVSRGPLTYSLKIGERWNVYKLGQKWAASEVFPTTPWNYGLIVDTQTPEKSFEVMQADRPLPSQPFTLEDAPIQLRAKGRRIPQWTLESNGLIGEVQQSPVRSDQPVEDIVLIPMGCARLRVSAFPQIGEGAEAREWEEVGTVTVTASHLNPSDTLQGLNSDLKPVSSSDLFIPRFTWWDHRGTEEWVQYDFAKPKRISWCEVYWFDDEIIGGQCRVPKSWRLLWWDGNGWQPVTGVGEFGVRKDRANRLTFRRIETTRLRIEATLQPGFSGGLLRWSVGKQP
jgi:DUF1680 family protein